MERLWWSELETPIGRIGLASSERGLARLLLPNQLGERRGDAQPDDGRNGDAARQMAEYFAGDRRDFDLALDPGGTEFQRRVWAEVAAIPYGRTRTYGELARRIGAPAAHRAVGAANGDNPLPLVVPCHRVVGSNGHLVGYAGTTPVKRWLLELEGAVPRADERFPAWAIRRIAQQPSLLIGPRSTHVFCRPTCRYGERIRNVPALFDSPAEAVAEGYRACRVCQPA